MVVFVAMIPAAPASTATLQSLIASSASISGAILRKTGWSVISFAIAKIALMKFSFCRSRSPGVLGEEILITM